MKKGKLVRFIKSEDKINMMILAMHFLKQELFYKWRFKEFGKKSLIISPMRLIGSRYISLGGGINVLNNARIEAIDSYKNQYFFPSLKIGDNTSIGQNSHIICAGELKIGKNVTISGNVYVSDVLHDYKEKNVNILEQKLIIERTEIGDNCFIGYGATIQPGAMLGKQCIVGANAVVLKGKYPDYSVLAGIPAKIIRELNEKNNIWERV